MSGKQMNSNPSVAEYVVQRLAALGIKHVFGLPGDFAFPIDNAFEACKELTWIGCSNELNAAYSADGYARVHGAAILCTTYNVGEAAALAGVMGCKAERVPVFHVVGAPSARMERNRRHMHHAYGDGNLDQFHHYNQVSACASAYLTPENAIPEMERVIFAALSQRMPAYIQIPQDYALMPVVGVPVHGVPLAKAPTFSSNAQELNAALTAILSRLTKAKSPVILSAFTIGRYGLQKELEALLAATGIPFATTGMSKGLLSESHPLYLGMYNGEASKGDVRKIVEGADLVLDLGGVLYCDADTGGYSAYLDSSKLVTVWPDYVKIGSAAVTGGRGEATYSPIHIKDVLEELTKQAPKFKTPTFSQPAPFSASGASGDRVTDFSVFSRVQRFLASGDTIVADAGTGDLLATEMLLPDGVHFHHAALWNCIGWGTAAALGVALANPTRRVILVQGDGGHQLTANQIGTMGRYGVNPIILLLNNGIFGIEEIVLGNSDPAKIRHYDRIAPWQYHKLPEAMGCCDWFCTSVKTNAEFDAALEKARKHPGAAYVEILLGCEKIVPGLPAEALDRIYQTGPPKDS
jgi:indolepyruvate decarboxylase